MAQYPRRVHHTATLQELGIERLSQQDRLSLAEAIWQSVASEIERAPSSEAQRGELERRLADTIARPEAVTPWEIVKARALARARS
jgi:putative addiction module component (TIGR02574 family)